MTLWLECNNSGETKEVLTFYFIPAPDKKGKQIYNKEEIWEKSLRKLNEKIVTYCQHMEEVEKYENISKQLASLGDSQIVELTQCRMSCSQTIYTSRQVSLKKCGYLPYDKKTSDYYHNIL